MRARVLLASKLRLSLLVEGRVEEALDGRIGSTAVFGPQRLKDLDRSCVILILGVDGYGCHMIKVTHANPRVKAYSFGCLGLPWVACVILAATMSYVERKNLNLDVPMAVNRLLDKPRNRGKGNFSPAVAAAVYAFYVEMDANQREEVFDRYNAWLESAEDAAVDEKAAGEAATQAQSGRVPRKRQAG